jgi:hypothetical protein
MKKTILWLVSTVLAGPAFAINMIGFKGTPIDLLTAEEKKAFHTALVQVLNQAPDRATIGWKASRTKLESKITPLNRVEEGQLLCRQSLIESNAPERKHQGAYVFCRNLKGEWQFKQAASKAVVKKKK